MPIERATKTAFVLPMVPKELGIDPLLLATLHAVAFLALSEDDAVDPDRAIEAMEYMGHYLGRLPPKRVKELRADLKVLSAHARKARWPAEAREFVETFWENTVGDE